MTPTVYLWVDPRGWPAPLDPDLLSAILQARLMLPVEISARVVGERWFDELPSEPCVVILLLTRPVIAGWLPITDRWLNSSHRLYVIYTDGLSASDIRDVARMTAEQPVARAPYRIAQLNAAGLENAMQWASGILQKAGSSNVTPAPPPLKLLPARWRHLPSNLQDDYYYPEDFTVSMNGAAHYRLVAASHRGKTHAHQGTFREDAVAASALAERTVAMPNPPAVEDVGREMWAGLRAAYHGVKGFATEHEVRASDLNTTLQLLIHWPQEHGCLLGVAHIGDSIVTAETLDGQYYLLTDPDTDPDDSSRTLFLTSGPLKQWMERAKVYQFDEPLDIVALMTDGLSGDLEPYAELLHTNLIEALRNRVLSYPLNHTEQALLALISYDRRGSFDDRTLAVLSRG